MGLKTTRVRKGHYQYHCEGYGTFNIEKKGQYAGNWWQAVGPKDVSGLRSSKKSCLEWVERQIEIETGRKPRPEKRRESQTTFDSKNRTSAEIRAQLPYPSNGCVPIAFARALCLHENASDTEIGIMAAMVSEELSEVDNKGVHRGNLSQSARKMGIEHTEVRAQKKNSFSWRRKDYPTVAQFLRKNPNIKTAIMRTTGHAAYYEDGNAFSLGARARIDHALVLEWHDDK